MHYRHLIMVQADNTAAAIEQAEAAIAPYGDGDVWDCYEVYEAAWAEDLPAGPLSLQQNKTAFLKALRQARADQRESLQSYLQMLMPDRTPLDATVIGQRAGAFFETMARTLAAGQMPDESFLQRLKADPDTLADSLFNYALRRSLDLVTGHYISGSYFYDDVAGSTAVMSAEAAEEAFAQGENLWIVAMDLHN